LPWYRTLGFRFGALLAVLLVGFDLLREPLYNLALRLLGLGGAGDVSKTLAGALVSAAGGIAVAILLAFALSRWLTGRLSDLAHSAAGPGEDGELPGPFDASGNDEVAMLAGAMNSLRDRVEKQLKAFSLKDLRRREWIAQVSHDLRTPLTAQISCLDRADSVLERLDQPLLKNELKELVTVAKMDADRVHTLADDLLEIARLEAGDPLQLEPVPPGELVRQAARRLEPMATQKEMRIVVTVTRHLPVLNADGRRLTRAIENLLRNAVQHARSRIEILAMLTTDCVRFEVRDDGRGLPNDPDFLAYLRRLGTDARLTRLAGRREGDSAGLGLIVAQRVTEAHRGILDARNLSGGGAAFWMDIPMPAEGELPSDEADPDERSSED
jgi:two-component system sensor histidine kinase MtrB